MMNKMKTIMKKRQGVLLLLIGLVCTAVADHPVPYYFLAVHNEPFHVPGGERRIEESYAVLKEMVRKAEGYHMKLTLMFSPQWADYITRSEVRLAELAAWKEKGHEIAAHHHSISHGNWDGYTDAPREVVLRMRRSRTRHPEPYLGTMDDFMKKLRLLNPELKCGCLNDETNKNALPDGIVHDTCSGFANFGQPGIRFPDHDPRKGRNEFITVGFFKDIPRRWLTHFQTTHLDRVEAARKVFDGMNTGVYGSVNHSARREQEAFNAWLDFLHERDPEGVRDRTVSEVIDEKLIPERELPDGHPLNSHAGLGY
jgi:hypothetical protein